MVKLINYLISKKCIFTCISGLLLTGCDNKTLAKPHPKVAHCIIYSVNFNDSYRSTLSDNNVVVFSDRILSFRSPKSVKFIQAWENILKTSFWKPSPHAADTRVVIDLEGRRYTFDGNGRYGLVDGKMVE
jgi:hypothetical protein